MSSPLISPRELAVQWLDITVERFVANMRKLKIENTGSLLASFRKEVVGLLIKQISQGVKDGLPRERIKDESNTFLNYNELPTR